MGIDVIYLFGSYAQGREHVLSDIDIGIIFRDPEKYKGKTMDVYLKLYDILTDVLPKEYLERRFKMKEHELDIVFLQFAPIALQFNVIRNNKVLYEKDENRTLQYQEYILKRYLDLKYFYDLSNKYLLERI